jgi:glycosyltransferase involved in cell wall biosynthesis
VRIAFITPEFITESPRGGGLGNYLNRITALLAAEHHVEVFVISDRYETLRHHGILVHRIKPNDHALSMRIIWRLSRILGVANRIGWALRWYPRARAIAEAVNARQRDIPFDFIQSADLHALGLLIPPDHYTKHIVRCSHAQDLFATCHGDTSREARAQAWFERQAIARAGLAYAPSQCIADHFQSVHNLNVHVLRPPAAIEIEPSPAPPIPLPPKFFVHFGRILPRKGSDHILRALPQVWQQCPDFTMLFSGTVHEPIQKLLAQLNLANDPRLLFTGPLTKPDLYAILRHAAAAVLPSIVDNLPNTAIESLALGLPVIAFHGASLNELITTPTDGTLVEMNSTKALAEAMIHHWQNPLPKNPSWTYSEIARQMHPPTAVANLLTFAGFPPHRIPKPLRKQPRPTRHPRKPQRVA